MFIKLIQFQKALRCACLLILALMTGNAAFAADKCATTEGSAPLTFNYDFKSSYDISALAVGSVIDAVTVTATDNFKTACPGTTAATVVAGILSGGGLTTNAFGGSTDSLKTRVAGVGVRITSGRSVWLPHPQSTVPSVGPSRPIWTITFFKISSDNTGNDTMPATASATVAIGDNKLQVYKYIISNSIRFIRGDVTTCTPTVVPGGAIRLPSVTSSPSLLGTSGQTAGNTSFSIQLNNCKTGGANANAVTVRTYFNGPRVNASTGNLNVIGSATNVQLQLTNGDGSVINLAGASGSQNVATAQVIAGTASLPYAVRYFATGRVGPGSVSSTVDYTIEYP